MNRFRTMAVLGGVAVLALGAGFAVNSLRIADSTSAGLSADADIAALFAARMPGLDGKDTALEQWRGRVLVVNFWATWCTPCREEIPDFIKLQDEFGARGVQFVGIAADQAEKVVPFAAELRMNYPQLIGNFAAIELARRTGNKIEALPYTIVLDRQGKLIHRQLGILKPDRLRDMFAKIL